LAQSQTVIPLILDYRECSKIKSSFCDPTAEELLGWQQRGTSSHRWRSTHHGLDRSPVQTE